jgi:hypothetical protein
MGARIGEHRSERTEIKKGQHISIDTEIKKGNLPWNKGAKGVYSASEETRTKISMALTGKKRGHYKGHEPEEKTCPICEKIFLAGGRGNPARSAKYCSNKCRSKAKYNTTYTSCNELTQTEASYIAGIIDGEGSIMLLMSKNRCISLRVTIAQSEKSICLLNWVLKTTGIGSIIVTKRQVSEKHDRGMHWQCNALSAVSMLEQISPYLIVKRRQADLSLLTMERLKDPKLKADKEWQKEYKRKIQELNKRGPNIERSLDSSLKDGD